MKTDEEKRLSYELHRLAVQVQKYADHFGPEGGTRFLDDMTAANGARGRYVAVMAITHWATLCDKMPDVSYLVGYLENNAPD